MKLPNKAISFKESVFYTSFEILKYLNEQTNKELSIYELRDYFKKTIEIVLFIEALKILKILNKIDLKNEGIVHVKGNSK